jgi:hypothetical protein
VKITSLALLASVMTVSPAQATNCSSVTGTSLRQTDDLWIFEWNALTDTTNVDALNVFVTSGLGSQSWYNNSAGRYWQGLPSSATLLLANKLSLIYFMNEQDISEITFSVRKDNGTDGCYPLSTIGTITPSRLSTPSNIQVIQTVYNRATITFDSHPQRASDTLTLTPTDGGTPIVLPDFVSGTEISNLLGSTSYTISLKTLGGVSNINSLPAIVEFTTSQDPVEVARLAELARVEAARLAELARLAAIAQAKTEIQAAIKAVNGLTLDMLAKAEIKGATKSNLPQINKELAQLSPEKRGDLKEILRVIRKFEVLDILASSDTSKIQSRLLIEIGLIPSDSDNKTSLMNAVRRLSPVDRSTYEAIQSAIKLELQGIQARKDRTAAILKKIKNR